MENEEDEIVIEGTPEDNTPPTPEEVVEIVKKERKFMPDIRQSNFWKHYLDMKSDTYSNGYQSAKKAGFSEYYAKTITTQGFFKRKMARHNRLTKAERVLDQSLEVGHIGEGGKIDSATLRVKADVAKFIAKTLGKDEGYTERTEVSGNGGSGIVFMPMELFSKYNLGEEKVEKADEEVEGE